MSSQIVRFVQKVPTEIWGGRGRVQVLLYSGAGGGKEVGDGGCEWCVILMNACIDRDSRGGGGGGGGGRMGREGRDFVSAHCSSGSDFFDFDFDFFAIEFCTLDLGNKDFVR